MNYSFIIIGDNGKQSEIIQQCMENFRHYSCLGIFENDMTTIETLIKLKPHLVFVYVDSFVKNTAFSFDTVNELYQYMDIVPYFVALSDTPQYALQAIQSGFSEQKNESNTKFSIETDRLIEY